MLTVNETLGNIFFLKNIIHRRKSMPIIKHGNCKLDETGRRNKLYNRWSNIKDRCLNKNSPVYKNYGGRGIFVCDEWKNSFKKFQEWAIKNGYDENLTLDRTDNNDGYYPNNCRWVSSKVQNRNHRGNVVIKIEGKEKCLMEWCEIKNFPYHLAQGRVRSGIKSPEAIFNPILYIKEDTYIKEEKYIKSNGDVTTRYRVSIPLGSFDKKEDAVSARDKILSETKGILI